VSSRLDKAVSVTLALAALAIAGSVVVKTFFLAPIALEQGETRAKTAMADSDWSEAIRLGLRVFGDSTASVTVVQFTDLECPACRAFDNVLHTVLAGGRQDVQVLLVHFPLTMHRFAKPAARARECAHQEGAADRFTSTVFTNQDSLGLIAWTELAHRAGIGDTELIGRCAIDPAPVRRIEESVALGQRIGVRGTPTVFINGWRFGVPSPEELEKSLDAMRENPLITPRQ
jgi:protein-disulfide isomerase